MEEGRQTAADLEAIGGQPATEENPQEVAGAAVTLGETRINPETGEQEQQVHVQVDLGSMIREAVKVELRKLLEETGVEPPMEAFDRLEARVSALEKDLESRGLLTRPEVFAEASAPEPEQAEPSEVDESDAQDSPQA